MYKYNNRTFAFFQSNCGMIWYIYIHFLLCLYHYHMTVIVGLKLHLVMKELANKTCIIECRRSKRMTTKPQPHLYLDNFHIGRFCSITLHLFTWIDNSNETWIGRRTNEHMYRGTRQRSKKDNTKRGIWNVKNIKWDQNYERFST